MHLFEILQKNAWEVHFLIIISKGASKVSFIGQYSISNAISGDITLAAT